VLKTDESRFIDTPILNENLEAALVASGADVFGLKEDAVKAVLKICTDTSVHGMPSLPNPLGERERNC
jgi:hypothetical protein